MARRTALEIARAQDDEAQADYSRAKKAVELYYIARNFDHAHYTKLVDRKKSFESIWNLTGDLALALEDEARGRMLRRPVAEIRRDLARAREMLATDPRLTLSDAEQFDAAVTKHFRQRGRVAVEYGAST